jgi:hypothetical protein
VRAILTPAGRSVGPARRARHLDGRHHGAALVALLVGLVVAACSGPAATGGATDSIAPSGSPAASDASPGAPVASAPSGSPAASDASPGATPSTSAAQGDFTGGTATASLTLPGGSVGYAGGSCEHGPGNDWVAVNIGQPNGPEYFGLTAGRSPYGASDVRTASGGGTLKGDAVLITYRHAGAPFVLDHDSASVFLFVDTSGGTFTGHLADGTNVSGTFRC